MCFINSLLFSYFVKRGYTYLLFENGHFTIEIGFKGSLEPPLHRVYQPLTDLTQERKKKKTHLWMSIHHDLGLTLQSASTAPSSKPHKNDFTLDPTVALSVFWFTSSKASSISSIPLALNSLISSGSPSGPFVFLKLRGSLTEKPATPVPVATNLSAGFFLAAPALGADLALEGREASSEARSASRSAFFRAVRVFDLSVNVNKKKKKKEKGKINGAYLFQQPWQQQRPLWMYPWLSH